MPAIAQIAQTTQLASPLALVDALAPLVDARRITRTQLLAIMNHVRDRLPASVTLAQRTRLGVVYVTAHTAAGDLAFTVLHRPRAQGLPAYGHG